MSYTWGYIKSAALAKLDLAEPTDNETDRYVTNLISRFVYYANEVITQVCSAIKPKRTFVSVTVTEDDLTSGQYLVDISTLVDDFISFGDDVCTIRYYNVYGVEVTEECHDDDFEYKGQFNIAFYTEGTYSISYNARWYTFGLEDGNSTNIAVPNDILDCIPSYIASQCFKIDDEYKAQVFRNEYEMFLARIEDVNYSQTKTIKIGGDW